MTDDAKVYGLEFIRPLLRIILEMEKAEPAAVPPYALIIYDPEKGEAYTTSNMRLQNAPLFEPALKAAIENIRKAELVPPPDPLEWP